MVHHACFKQYRSFATTQRRELVSNRHWEWLTTGAQRLSSILASYSKRRGTTVANSEYGKRWILFRELDVSWLWIDLHSEPRLESSAYYLRSLAVMVAERADVRSAANSVSDGAATSHRQSFLATCFCQHHEHAQRHVRCFVGRSPKPF